MNSTPASGKTLQLVLAILCLLALGLSAFLGQGWLGARQENAALRAELDLSIHQTRIVQQQLEAERLVSRRQVELLKAGGAFPPANNP